MRVISQDGMIDVPYEQMTLNINYRNNNQIMAEGAHCNGENTIFSIAQYATEAKAKKAMEMLHNYYYEHEAEKNCREGVNYIYPYFQFPSDEDVEV